MIQIQAGKETEEMVSSYSAQRVSYEKIAKEKTR